MFAGLVVAIELSHSQANIRISTFREIADLVSSSTGSDLDLSGRNIKSLETAFVAQTKEFLAGKTSVDISYNNLRSLPEDFSKFCALETLNISYNSFKGDLPHQISTLRSLTSFRMNMNVVTSLEALCPLENLRVLQVRLGLSEICFLRILFVFSL